VLLLFLDPEEHASWLWRAGRDEGDGKVFADSFLYLFNGETCMNYLRNNKLHGAWGSVTKEF
jgi:hypothetical protein